MKDAKMSVVCCTKILAQNSKWFRRFLGFSRGNDLYFAHCTRMVNGILEWNSQGFLELESEGEFYSFASLGNGRGVQ